MASDTGSGSTVPNTSTAGSWFTSRFPGFGSPAKAKPASPATTSTSSAASMSTSANANAMNMDTSATGGNESKGTASALANTGASPSSSSSPSTTAFTTAGSTSTATAAPPKARHFLVNDPARTGYDPRTSWWVNYLKIQTGQMTAEGVHHYREDRYRANEERDCKSCEAMRDNLFARSPVVRFLNGKIEALGGKLDASNVVCLRCPTRIDDEGNVYRSTGGFSPPHGIMICANEINGKRHLEDTLAHEMVHAWDHLRWRMDWMGELSLRHAACTEIRASMLSGECRWTNESLKGGNWTLTQQFQDCVRRRAVQSVMGRPTCKDDLQAVRVVNEVWDSCFNDKRPFEEIFR